MNRTYFYEALLIVFNDGKSKKTFHTCNAEKSTGANQLANEIFMVNGNDARSSEPIILIWKTAAAHTLQADLVIAIVEETPAAATLFFF